MNLDQQLSLPLCPVHLNFRSEAAAIVMTHPCTWLNVAGCVFVWCTCHCADRAPIGRPVCTALSQEWSEMNTCNKMGKQISLAGVLFALDFT